MWDYQTCQCWPMARVQQHHCANYTSKCMFWFHSAIQLNHCGHTPIIASNIHLILVLRVVKHSSNVFSIYSMCVLLVWCNIFHSMCVNAYVSLYQRIETKNQQIFISAQSGRSSKLTHTRVGIDTYAFQTDKQLSSAASAIMSLGLCFFIHFLWNEMNVLDNWPLAVLPQCLFKFKFKRTLLPHKTAYSTYKQNEILSSILTGGTMIYRSLVCLCVFSFDRASELPRPALNADKPLAPLDS